MHQASILMTVFVALMGALWLALETGAIGPETGEAMLAHVEGPAVAREREQVRFQAKIDAADLAAAAALASALKD